MTTTACVCGANGAFQGHSIACPGYSAPSSSVSEAGREPTCPTCGKALERVTYPGGYLNEDQWESVRAGDWWCETCPNNGRGRKGAYYWNREVLTPASSPVSAPERDATRGCDFAALQSRLQPSGIGLIDCGTPKGAELLASLGSEEQVYDEGYKTVNLGPETRAELRRLASLSPAPDAGTPPTLGTALDAAANFLRAHAATVELGATFGSGGLSGASVYNVYRYVAGELSRRATEHHTTPLSAPSVAGLLAARVPEGSDTPPSP